MNYFIFIQIVEALISDTEFSSKSNLGVSAHYNLLESHYSLKVTILLRLQEEPRDDSPRFFVHIQAKG